MYTNTMKDCVNKGYTRKLITQRAWNDEQSAFNITSIYAWRINYCQRCRINVSSNKGCIPKSRCTEIPLEI